LWQPLDAAAASSISYFLDGAATASVRSQFYVPHMQVHDMIARGFCR
jgi:hypothetical protein